MSALIPYCPNGCHLGVEYRKECKQHQQIGPPDSVANVEDFFSGLTDRQKWLNQLPYDAYLETDDWQKKRRHILARSDFTCHGCGSRKHLQVHHLTYERRDYELNSDLVVLCRNCHAAAHGLVVS